MHIFSQRCTTSWIRMQISRVYLSWKIYRHFKVSNEPNTFTNYLLNIIENQKVGRWIVIIYLFFSCKWKGKLEDITNHFQDNHKDNIGKMSYQYTGLINLHKKGDIQLFDAHNKKFIFVYDRKLPLPCNSFIYIACMGTEQQAKRYCYELEFFKPADVVSTLKYRIVCVSDSVPPPTVIQRNQCIFLCNNSIKHFIIDDTLNFRFWVKQVQHVIDAKTNRKK